MVNNTIPLISTKRTTTSNHSTQKKTTTYNVCIPSSVLDMHKIVAGLNRLMGFQPSLS
jgi:hypothetical protein